MRIPNEVAVQILLRLPVKSILRFRCVCKKWYKFLKYNSDFIRMRLNYSKEMNNVTILFTQKYQSGIFSLGYDPSSSLDSREVVQMVDSPFKDESIEIFGCCNGLVFIKIKPRNLVLGLWNPTTKEYKIIPYRNIKPMGFRCMFYSPWIEGRWERYGFGYDQNSNDYKLVSIVSPYNEEIMVSEIEIYTLSTNSWKRIDYIPYKVIDGPPGVFVNGALHWLAEPCPARSENVLSRVLLSFNLTEEVFGEIPYPECVDNGNRRIDVLEGLLAMLFTQSNVGFEVWVMNDYGVGESWTKRYTISGIQVDIIPSFWCLRRIDSLRNGEMLLEIQLDGYEHQIAPLVIYDPISQRGRFAEIDLGMYDKYWNAETDLIGNHARFHTETCVESLVSLHSGSYVGGGQEKSDQDDALSDYLKVYQSCDC